MVQPKTECALWLRSPSHHSSKVCYWCAVVFGQSTDVRNVQSRFCLREPDSAALCEAGTQRTSLCQTDSAGKMGHTGKQKLQILCQILLLEAVLLLLEFLGVLTTRMSWFWQKGEDAVIPSNVFGVDLHQLVKKERSDALVPLLIQKTVAEIELRGLKVGTNKWSPWQLV